MNEPWRATVRTVGTLSLAASLLTTMAASAVAQTDAPTQPPAELPTEPPAGSVAVSVRGTSTLVGQLAAGTTTLDDGVYRTRGSILVTQEEANDPRASGQGTIRLDLDAYPGADGRPAATQVRYGSMRIENADGAWEGPFAGRLSDTGFSQTYWLEGEGAYEGLTYVVSAGGNGNVWLTAGLIYPGEIPPMGRSLDLPIDGQGPGGPAA